MERGTKFLRHPNYVIYIVVYPEVCLVVFLKLKLLTWSIYLGKLLYFPCKLHSCKEMGLGVAKSQFKVKKRSIRYIIATDTVGRLGGKIIE